ncbi:MAG TPA: DNA-processing protein DprA [Spirochaetia bacterium]|nr:DNA-processing protein DprA [Spirochaetia bacterium]
MASRELLGLAVQRMPALRPDEKLLLWDLVSDEASFASLSRPDLQSILGRRLEAASWTCSGLLAEAESDAAFLARIGAFHLRFDDPRYPAALREAFRAPFGLYCRGLPPPQDRPCAAIVGTRLPTGRGLEAAIALASGLAAAGIPVASGLARGIDAAAHRGALRERGYTCAVLPCGLDAVYPPSNRSLAAAIVESGGLLATEYPPGSAMHKYRFPERNRIIAGLARACLVVEAPLGSGALITAEHALQEGRDVWVAKACLGGSRSAGMDKLAAEGAPALEDAAGLLADWGLLPPSSAARGRAAGSAPAPAEGGRLASSLRGELGLEEAESAGAACG